MPKLTAAQLSERRSFLGASDVARLLGDPEGPWKVYNEKVEGLLEEVDPEREDAMNWGHLLEPVIAQRYEEELGVRLLPGIVSMRHPDHAWAAATLDRKVSIDGTIRRVEIKLVGGRMMYAWNPNEDDGVPDAVRIQNEWQAYVSGIDLGDIAANLGGTRFAIFRIEPDVRLRILVAAAASAFWHDHVEARRPPPLDGSDACRAYLAAKYPRDVRDLEPAPAEACTWGRKRAEAAKDEKQAKEVKDEADNRLRALIGDGAGFYGPGFRVSWKVGRDKVTRRYRFGAKDES